MTNQTKIQPNQRQKTVVQLTRVFESYLGFPKVDAELDQKRQQQNSAFQRSEREKTKNTELIRQIASNVHSDVRAVTLRLSDRGATMPAVVPVPVAGKSSIEALSKIQSEIGRNRRDIESALREIDDLLRVLVGVVDGLQVRRFLERALDRHGEALRAHRDQLRDAPDGEKGGHGFSCPDDMPSFTMRARSGVTHRPP